MKENQVIALISNDKVGKVMAGPGIRYFELAKAFSKHFKTVLFVPDSCNFESTDFEIRLYDSSKISKKCASIGKKIKDVNYIISQSLQPQLIQKIKLLGIKYIADMYDPLTIEVLEYARFDSERTQRNVFNFNYYSQALQLNSADHILCASQRQKDFYFGILSDQKFINPKTYRDCPDFSELLSLAPFGMKSEEPVADTPDALEKKFPQIKSTDKIIYWGGGIWNWFDPLTVVKAIEEISKTRDDVKLYFIGAKHPNPKIKQMEMAHQTLEYCKEKDLLDKFVFFNFDWTPYEERVNYLLRASIGVSAHFDNLETNFSFRTRVLDYFWAKLPIVSTRGDSMADLIEKHDLGRVVDFEDYKGMAKAMLEIIDSKETANKISKNIAEFKSAFYWDNIILTLVDLIKNDKIKKRNFSNARFISNTFNFYFTGLKKKLFK